jgi:pimeloyl-ACP methyl ester carboxylesterase
VRTGFAFYARAVTDWRLRRRVELSDAALAYDVFGEGPPVVFVHGTPSWSYIWRNVAPKLAESFSVHVFDLLGYGDSPALDGADLSLTAHARRFVELLDALGLDVPAVVGHDIGGGIVLRTHLIERRPFRRIALVDAVALAPWITAPTRHMQKHLDVYRTMPVHIYEQIVTAHLRTAVAGALDDDRLAAYLRPWRGEDGQAAYLEKVAQFDEEETREFEPLLGSIDVPVLILWGEHDAWLDASLAKRLAEAIPGAPLELIPGAGHFAMEDAPEAVAQALAEFLAE